MINTQLLPLSFALVLAASLASYALSRTDLLRQRTVAWTGMTVGTALLLLAAALLLLSVNISWRWWSAVPEPHEPREMEISIGRNVLHAPDIEAEAIEQRTAARERSSREDLTVRTRSTDASAQEAAGAAPLALPDPLLSGNEPAIPRDPWSATECVVAINPDPADPGRWSFENGCAQAVAIFIAPCHAAADGCGSRAHGVHAANHVVLMLPARYQRPVTDAEQTYRGIGMQFEACYAGRTLHALLGSSSETRATSAWQADYASALARESCGGVPMH